MVAVSALPPPKEMGVCAVARARGLHRHTVRKWMREVEEKLGSRYVYRRGARLYTTDIALELLLAVARDRRTEAILGDHEQRIGDLERARTALSEKFLEILRIVRTPGGLSAKLRKA
ncbi:MAG TPA: hypothetical protein VGI39_04800 [Polyangiaceae bacterium]|jgi:transposase-like protein